MDKKTIFIYTDASFSKSHNVAVIGHAKFDGINQHTSVHLSELELQIQVIPETNNIRAELQAAIHALKSCVKNSKIVLYSDCHSVTQLSERKEKLEKENFISQSSGLILSNADLYKEFYKLSDQFDLKTFWVKGHSANKKSDVIQSNFSYLDKQVRKKLRLQISS